MLILSIQAITEKIDMPKKAMMKPQTLRKMFLHMILKAL